MRFRDLKIGVCFDHGGPTLFDLLGQNGAQEELANIYVYTV